MSRLKPRILVPVDGSYESALALPRSVELAVRLGGEITLLASTDLITERFKKPDGNRTLEALGRTAAEMTRGASLMVKTTPDLRHDASDLTQDYRLSAARKYITVLAADVRRHGLPVKTLVKPGPATERIVETAAEERFDLICMASSSTQVQRWMGDFSTTIAVASQSTIPVCIIGSKESLRNSEDHTEISQLFLLLAGEDEAASEYAICLAKDLGIPVSPVCVCNSWSGIMIRSLFRNSVACGNDSQHAQIISRLRLGGVTNGVQILLGCGIPRTVKHLSRQPGAAFIMSRPPRNPAAVITIGSALQRAIRHSRSPLFVVPVST